MAKRFSRLKYALTLLRATTAEGTPVDAPSGTFLEKYQEFAKGQTAITVNREDDSLPGSIERVAINPFGKPLEDANQLAVPFSNRVKSKSSFTALIGACNHSVPGEEDELVRGFTPAKAVVRIATGDATDQTSQITGKKYQAKDTASYTLPYGQKTDKLHESIVRADIVTAATATGVGGKVTFNSEEL